VPVTKGKRTRQYIIEKTAPLFNSKGFDGTSMADLENATGLTKGSLYGNFADKQEIAVEAFRYAIARTQEKVRLHLKEASSFKAQLYALLDFYSQYVFDPPVAGGCPLLNTAIEADDHRVSMRSVVVSELMNTINFISTLLRNGMEAGEFDRTINPEEQAYTFFCAIEGAVMFSRVEQSREPMDIIVRHCKSILDKIST
jgi:TetR/AcrR family transcriptional repressor of nem operon